MSVSQIIVFCVYLSEKLGVLLLCLMCIYCLLPFFGLKIVCKFPKYYLFICIVILFNILQAKKYIRLVFVINDIN